jgi:hypothetical protein
MYNKVAATCTPQRVCSNFLMGEKISVYKREHRLFQAMADPIAEQEATPV